MNLLKVEPSRPHLHSDFAPWRTPGMCIFGHTDVILLPPSLPGATGRCCPWRHQLSRRAQPVSSNDVVILCSPVSYWKVLDHGNLTCFFSLLQEHRASTKHLQRILFWAKAHSSIMVEALCYEPEGRGFETRWGEWIYFNLSNPSGRTRPCGLPTNQLRGFSPRANYTDRAIAACRRS
jgi:hypothetical protein